MNASLITRLPIGRTSILFASRGPKPGLRIALTHNAFINSNLRQICTLQVCKTCSTFQKPRALLVPKGFISCVQKSDYGSIYEPEYLDVSGPEIPYYDVLNVQMKGYDFPVIEKFAKYVHKTAERVGLTVEEAWATPCKKLRITKLKPESNVLETEFFLNVYERTVQISDVPATLLPIFINVVEASIPVGVSLRINPDLPEHTEVRYVPDLQLKELRAQLDSMRGEKKEAK